MTKGVRAGVAMGLGAPDALGARPVVACFKTPNFDSFRGLGRGRRWAKLFDRAKRKNLT